MLKNERHRQIMEILKKNSFATVASLASSLYASLPTIRRDLTILEEDGYVKRCHGGAMILDGNTKPPVYFRREQYAQEKLKMCKVASTLISEGDTVFIDASTSAFHIADFLEKEQGVTVITNGLPIATRLTDTGIKVSGIHAGYDVIFSVPTLIAFLRIIISFFGYYRGNFRFD